MATLSHSESRRRYSWWWNSHINPKNSKWLQENLKDVDMKVKSMIKLLEEDADSFARRAEMYYKKRPELMKLVEEFYRAYRALAERYDHATGALRQAHRAMAEAFPNQIPLMLPDESPYGSNIDDVEPNTPETPPPGHPGHALFDPNDLKDTAGLPSDFHVFNTQGSYSKEAGLAISKNDLRKSNEIFAIVEGRARKGLDFNQEGEGYPNKESNGLRGFQMVKEKHNSYNVIKDMQQDVSRLSTENQDLKSQIMETSDCVNDAENEIQTFKDTLSKLNSQKDADHHQHRLCLEKISSLESQLSNTQNGMKKLDDELVNKVHKLLSAEELIQSLRSELALLDKKAKMQDRELKAKQEELNELNIALQDKHQQCKQAEISLLSMEKQLSESQEELKFINLEIRNETNKLRDVEFRKEKLEEDIHKIKGENSSLKEENLQYDLTIKGLEEEISLLKDKRSKLEEEVEVHVMEKESLKQELFILQGDRNDLEKRIKDLLEEMEAANFASDTLQAAINELESEKIELKDNCKKMEAEKETLMEKLKDMDTISEENKILENSLSDGNAEIEVLKEKIAALNDSNEYLKLEISTLIAEKDSLVSELEIITQNVENLSAKNAFLENELSYANSEVGSLKAKLKDFEYSCQFLKNQNSVLHTEKITLISQVESINLNLENLADKFAELHDNHSSLSRDSISQIKELQNLLELEKQEQKSLLESHKVKLASLENIIYLLQKENLLKVKNLEAEQNNLFCAMIEIFMLQTSLSEAHETNASLSLEGRKNLQAKERAEALVSQLEQEKLIQLGNISSLSRHHEKLTKQIHLLNNTLHADKDLNSLDQIQDEILLDSAIAEAKKLLNFISDVKCENQKMHLQVSVLVTLLRQIAVDMIGLRTEKFSLENELEIKTKKILLLEKKQVELNHREEVVQAEMKVLSVHLGNIQEAVQTSKCESVKLIEEKRTLSEELYNLWQNHNELEEEKVELCLEAMKLDYLCTFFKCLSAERSAELKCFSQDLASLHSNQSFLETEINRLNRELTVISSENTQLLKLMAHLEEEHKKSLLHLEFDLNTTRSFYEELNNQSQNTRAQLSEKEAQLLEANQKVESTEGEMAEMHTLLHAFQLENNEAMQAREELVKMISMLSEVVAIKKEEISFLHESLETLQKDNDRLQTREKSLLSERDTQKNEFEISEGIIAALLADIQLLKGNVAICEEKVQDTIVEEEIRSMVEKQILTMELGLTKNYVDILKTKHNDLVEQNRGLMDDMGIYPPKITSLSNAIACLEEVMPIMNAKSLENQNKIEDIASVPHHHCCNQLYEDWDNNISGVLELEKLIAKVEALQKAAVETKILLKGERLDSSSRLEAACIEVEELKMKALSQQPEIHSSSNKTSNLAYDRDVDDDAFSIDKYGQVIKDITLDQVSSPLPHMNSSSSDMQSSKYVEIDDQLLEAAERDCNNKTWKVSPVVVGNAMDLMGEEKSEVSSSGLLAEELSIDKLQRSDGALTSQNDWKEVTEGLTSDALRLAGIMSNVEELKRKMESLQIQELPPIFGYDIIKAQLKEAEGTVLELIDANSNLISKAQDHSFFNETEIKSDGPGNNGRWRISEQATRASEKVVRLEFELQKIRYVLLKLGEELENRRAKAAQRRTRVMLRDYLYGKKDNRRPAKQMHFCGCMRPKTTDDH